MAIKNLIGDTDFLKTLGIGLAGIGFSFTNTIDVLRIVLLILSIVYTGYKIHRALLDVRDRFKKK